MAPTGSSHINFTMAALVAAGGVFGYLKANSVPSLAAGLGFGAAFAASGWLIANSDPVKGHAASLATSALLTGAMGMRYLRTGKIMPAGVLTAAGLASSIYHFQKYKEWAG